MDPPDKDPDPDPDTLKLPGYPIRVEGYYPPPYGPPAAWTGGYDLQQQQHPPQGQGHE
ncbi:hypothetical protein F2Q69_00038349 [Brassica cretica]|uniref:Uncharacterized protein n=1 Tax=Brassica cretica TaxID=69181 RepID=A0A8S9SAR7_BRACR|nr:hypothetical protein F2Q69_00038349 [Brassica cretica]